MEDRVIVDTNILVDLLTNKPNAVEFFNRMQNNALATTDINAFELYFGAYKSKKQEKNLAATKGLLNSLILFTTSEDAMEVAGKIMARLEEEGRSIEIRDLLIGAIAMTTGFAVATNNNEHFKRVDGLEVIKPY
ncbi:MAG: type II toxin-antitoxin system VapC family toxin [Archaeoglobaceae archaeon]